MTLHGILLDEYPKQGKDYVVTLTYDDGIVTPRTHTLSLTRFTRGETRIKENGRWRTEPCEWGEGRWVDENGEIFMTTVWWRE